jgi:hypothetical protein
MNFERIHKIILLIINEDLDMNNNVFKGRDHRKNKARLGLGGKRKDGHFEDTTNPFSPQFFFILSK